jgi:hypothetical protein
VCPKRFMSLWHARRKVCTYLTSRLALSPNGLNWASTWASHLGAPSGATKMISEPMVRLAQTVQLPYVKISTISKRNETSIHLSPVTLEYYWVRPKWFLSLWYVQHKPCTYLASRLALPPNGMKRASTWALSSRSTIGCVQNDFWAYGTFGANHGPILRRH